MSASPAMPLRPDTNGGPAADATARLAAGLRTGAAGSTDFAALLAARLPDPSTLPTVSLGHMVAAKAGAVAPAPIADLAALSGVPAATGGTEPVNAPADSWGAAASRPVAAGSGPGAAVISAGERYLGVPYKWGGTSARTGFDCSGFVQRVFADLGVSLPRVSVDQSRAGRPVAGLDQARPGDLLFWRGNGSRPNHIGIYAGDGRMLVAPRTGDVVRFQTISRTPDAIRRVVD